MAGQNWSVRNNPISLNEMITIPQMAVEEHNKIEEGIANLQAEADKWEILANSAQDKAQYDQYKAYSNKLKEESDKLAMYGINANSRRDLYNLNREYAKKINPISQAFDYRAKMTEEQRKNNKDGKMLYDVDFSQVSLQDIMNNPNLSYKGINLEDARKEGGLAGQAASKRNVLTPEQKLIMNGQYYDMVTRQGYTEEQAAQFLANPQNNPELAAYVDQVFQAYDTSTFNDQQKQQLKNFITTGFVQGLTFDERHQLQGNGEYMTAYQKEMMAYRRREEQRKEQLQEQKMTEEGLRETNMGSSPDGSIVYYYIPLKKGSVSGQIWAYEIGPDGNVISRQPIEGGGVFNWHKDLFDPNTGQITYDGRKQQSSAATADPITGETSKAKSTGTGLNLAGKAFRTNLKSGLGTDKGGHSIDQILKPENYNDEKNTIDTGVYEASIKTGDMLSDSQKKAIKEYIKQEAKKYPTTAAGDVDLSNIVIILDEDWGTKDHWKIIAKDLFIEKARQAGFTDRQIINMLQGSTDFISEQNNIQNSTENEPSASARSAY